MKLQHQFIFAMSIALVPLCFARGDKAGKTGPATGQADQGHVMVASNEVKWGPAPPSLPAGAQLAVLDGDPAKAGAPFTIRAKFPDGYRVPPHWHPTDENVTVLAGTLGMGLGESFDPAKGHEMTAGSYFRTPKGLRHFAWAKGETVIQVHGVGPFEVTYVNPADDPRRKASPK